jgi:hypothetical protein
MGVTIYADEALLDAEGIVLTQPEALEEQPNSEELVEQFKNFIEGVRPEDFDK